MKYRFDSLLSSVALVLGSMISLTMGASLAKRLFVVAGPSGVTVVRIGWGALILCALWRPWRFRLSRAQLRDIILYGVCLGTMNLFFYLAISRLPIGLAIAIEFLGPLSIALWFSKKWIDLLWAFFAAAGIVLILPFTEISADVDLMGVAFALGAAALWALYIILGKKAGAAAHSGAVTSLGLLFGFLSIVPFGAMTASGLFASPTLILTALGVGILSSAIPYSLEMLALRNLPEKYFGLLLSLEPAIGAVTAFLFLGEKLTVVQCLAIACVVSASVGSTYSHKSASMEPTPQ